jgi:hypothetical protein
MAIPATPAAIITVQRVVVRILLLLTRVLASRRAGAGYYAALGRRK